ncbi:hypothetical protein [Desulfobulbus alkaliphilus]|uniref:hypothetical protein n=1 Tax=Desulfobulbus alkaliphilus TaxID=869814 RepID=UPI0019624D40|nr:hypothetical protein [Desulfobulbus alkaliphilus]MBM9537113.1 hypothetical protein [Desulfobulbus alkaliphilus]
MLPEEHDDRYIKEYKKMIKEYARMAADNPDMIEEMRASLKASASLIISNKPEAVSKFREIVNELDAFLHACQTGEVDPRALSESLDDET